MKRPYQEIGEQLDRIISQKLSVAQEMEAILAALKAANKTRARKTPSIKHGMKRTLAIVRAGVGEEIARECLSLVHMLVVFEDIQDLLNRDDPKITPADINALKATNWTDQSPWMEEFINVMERLAKGDNVKISEEVMVLNSDPESKKLFKKIWFERTVLEEARIHINTICIVAKLLSTVKIANAIAVAYLKGKQIKFPKGNARFTTIKGIKLNKDYNIKVHQVLYDISRMVDSAVLKLFVEQDVKAIFSIGLKIRVLFKSLTKMLDKEARVPKVTEENYHLSATFLHVLSRLQVAIDSDDGTKFFIAKLWSKFYAYTFHSGKEFSEDLSKNGMLQNLERFVKDYEDGLKSVINEEGLAEEPNPGALVEEEEDSSSLGDSFGCG